MHKEVRFRFDGDLWLHSPSNNVTTRRTFRRGYPSPTIFAWLHAYLRPGMVAIDVGANVGVFSIFIAKRVKPGGSVHAFEPNPRTFRFLKSNRERNKLGCLIANRMALSDKEAQLHFEEQRENLGSSHIAPGSGSSSPLSVRATTLDKYCAEAGISTVDLLKVDVEGFEISVLSGGRSMLGTSSSIVVLTEVGEELLNRYGKSRQDLRDLMESFGLKAYGMRNGNIGDFDWDDAKQRDALWVRDESLLAVGS